MSPQKRHHKFTKNSQVASCSILPTRMSWAFCWGNVRILVFKAFAFLGIFGFCRSCLSSFPGLLDGFLHHFQILPGSRSLRQEGQPLLHLVPGEPCGTGNSTTQSRYKTQNDDPKKSAMRERKVCTVVQCIWHPKPPPKKKLCLTMVETNETHSHLPVPHSCSRTLWYNRS